jgi:hypothetical protein
MEYKVAVNKVNWTLNRHGLPVFFDRKTIHVFELQCGSDELIDLLYTLARENSPLENLLRFQESGNYTLVFFQKKRLANKSLPPIYKYVGWAVISNRKGQIFWDTRYMNIGELNVYNLGMRDIREEVRNRNWRFVPQA